MKGRRVRTFFGGYQGLTSICGLEGPVVAKAMPGKPRPSRASDRTLAGPATGKARTAFSRRTVAAP